MDDFRYRPLDPQRPSFRLLKLLKGNTIEIECEIFHDSISDHATPYEALSYTWGCTDLVMCIKLNRKKLWITENLYAALQCLRYHDRDRVLWIDAVCIDQSNLEERSQQVQEMGMIFSFAKQVIFWLGRPTADAVLLLDALSELETKIVSCTREDLIGNDVQRKKLWSSAQSTANGRDCDESSRQRQRAGLQSLLRRPWFRRVWILQEVAKAQSAVVCSGMWSISAHIFALAPSLLDVDTDTHVQSILNIMPGPARANSWWSRERDLFNLLLKFRASKATDMRDMVFALIGMSTEPADHPLLCVDYNKPLPEVLHNTLRYWFQSPAILLDQGQVLHFLAGFRTVHATYLVSPEKFKTNLQVFSPPIVSSGFMYATEKPPDIDWETVECINDIDLLLLELHSGEGTGSMDTCYEELDKLQSKVQAYQVSHILQIESGRKQNIKFLIVKDVVETLVMVCRYGYKRTFKFIVDECTNDKQTLLNNALIAASDLDCWSTAEPSVNGGTHVSVQGDFLSNALLARSNCSHQRIVRMLLDEGADVNAPGSMRGSVLHAALAFGDQEKHKELVQILLDRGADVNAQAEWNGSILQTASCRGDKKLVQQLLDKGAYVNAQGGHYGNALQAACFYGPIEMIQMLLVKGACVNAQGGYYGNALQAACYYGTMEIVQLLLDKGADVNAQGGHYGNALRAAMIRCHKDVVSILLDHGADNSGETYRDALEWQWRHDAPARRRG